MKNIIKIVAVSLCATLVAGAAWAAQEEFKTDLEKESYAIGANVARRLKQQGTKVNADLAAKGLVDEMSNKSLLAGAEIDAAMQKLRDEAQKKAAADREKKAADNKQRGTAFMAENAKKEGVRILPGGVQYKVLKKGTGEVPTDDYVVLCNYRGMLLDGTVFDTSQPDKASSFKVKKVIPGWREALKQMPVGSKWELVIPSEKAYGEAGTGVIGPNETLIFEVELVGFDW